MRIFTLVLAFTVCFAISVDSVQAARRGSYRKNRGHKGLKDIKEYRIEKVVKRKKAVVVQKARRPMQLAAFQRFAKQRILERLLGQIRTLDEIIGQTPKRLRGDLYFRLAEHHWEVAKYYDFVGHKYDDFRGRPEWPEKRSLQTQAWNTAKSYRRKAAGAYFKIIRGYPDFNRLCEAYYFLGKNLFDMGQQKPALKVFRTMIQKFGSSYPKCPFIPNAYLAFGEHYFNNGQVRTALGSYQQVLHFRNSSIYAFALYKVAWCYYNLVRYRLSLKTFVEVVQHARNATGRWGSAGRRLQLLREAQRDLVLAYSQVGSVENARSNFYTWGGEGNYLKMMRNLGALYREQGKNQPIVTLYNELKRLQAGSPYTMLFQLYIAQAQDRISDKKTVIAEVFKLVRLVKHFRGVNSKSQVYIDAIKEIRPQMKEFATYRHYEGQKTRRLNVLAEAMQFYKAYLEVFGNEKDSLTMRFFYAELLYKQSIYEDAARQYTMVLKQNPKSKYARDAAYNPVLAYHKLMKKRGLDVTNVGSKRGKSTAKKALPPIAKRFLLACETFLKYFKKGERSLDVSYKAAQLYYYFNHFDKALPQFYHLVKTFPQHEYAIYSAHYILDVYNIQEQWVKLNKWAWKFYKMPNLGNPKFKSEVRDLIVQSGMKTCERIDQAKQYLDAAKCFNRFANEFGDNKRLAPTALFNASLNYYKARKTEKALQVRQQLLKSFPKSKFVKQTILDLAGVYADRADFHQSSHYYEMYVEKYSRDRKRKGKDRDKIWDAVTRAGRFREANGEMPKAIDHYKALLKDESFRKQHSQEYVSLYFRVADYHKKKGDNSIYASMMRKAYDWKDKRGRKIRQYIPKALQVHARMEYAMTKKRQGRKKEAEKIYSGVPGSFERISETEKKKYPQASYAAAHVRFINAEKLFGEYSKIRFKGNMDRKAMAKTLKEKSKALDKAWASYGKVIKYRQGHWGVAAYYRAGDISLNYSKFLYNAPTPARSKIRATVIKEIRKVLYRRRIPGAYHSRVLRTQQMRETIKNLVENSIQKFKDNIQARAQPYEDKAVEFYIKSLRMAHQLSVYNVWTQRSLAKLAELKPYDYPKPIEAVPAVGFSSSDFSFSKKIQGEIQQPAPSTPPPATPAAPPAKKTARQM